MKQKKNLPDGTFLSNVLNISHDAIIATDEDHDIILFNQGAERIFGYNSDEVIGKPLDTLLPLSVTQLHREHIQNFFNEEGNTRLKNDQVELFGRRKDGSIFEAEASIAKSSRDGKTFFSTVLRDVTKRKKAEAELIVSEARYRRLFETAKDGIIILDAETGMIVDVNPYLIELLDYPYEEFVEKAIWEIGFFKDIAANHDKFLELQKNEYVRYEDLPLETASGRKLNVEFVSNVYLVDNKKVIQCNIRDITKRKRAEDALNISEERLKFALSGTNDGLWDLEMNTGAIYISPRGWEILGYAHDEQEQIIDNWASIVHPEDIEANAQALKDYHEGRASLFIIEQRLKTAPPDTY